VNSRLFHRLGFGILLAVCSSAAAQYDPFAESSDGPSLVSQTGGLVQTSATETSTEESLEERLRRVEAELDQVKTQPRQNVFSLQESPLEQPYLGTGGLFGSVEVTFLRPYLSGAPATFGLATSQVINPNYNTGIRYTLGYANQSGLGARVRYWNYDTDANFVPPFTPSTLGIHLDAVDTEVTLGQRLCNWDLEVSGGVRYGKLQYSNGTPSLYGVGMLTFEGVGPTAGLSGRRILGDSGLSLFGNIRGSLLMGHINNGSLLTNMPRATISDEIMTIAENQLGVAWTRNVTSVLQLEIRGAWETQFWLNSTMSNDTYGIGSNLALSGPTIAVEMRY
jgi:hypothetical protein